jgi:hypothetical protein
MLMPSLLEQHTPLLLLLLLIPDWHVVSDSGSSSV